ncbi:YcxB family protein [Rugosimonospora africana]|uniref:YcxB-like protein n=1 Tax=Rugosimonospora africana TaxID=556532 RepID=A0A8J3VP23_9ACTN|nr:YcxB family protein [Rugosimonospora africana]GIH13645.1 hypothetical protein Raf01_18170 [Rugosimonospora africana]
MHIIIDAEPDLDRYAGAFRYVLRDAYRKVRILGAILAVLGVVLLALGTDAWPFGVGLLVIGVLYVIYIPRKSVRTSIRALPLVMRQPQRIEIGDPGVRILSPLMSTEYAWAAFEKTQEIPGQLLLMLGKRQVLPVPITTVPPEQLAELRDFLANRAFVRQ